MTINVLILLTVLNLTPAKQAEALAKQAEATFKAGNEKQALAQALHAYKVYPLPALLLNLARYYTALGEWSAAAATYRDYLKQQPTALDRPWVQARIAEVESRGQAGGLELTAVPLAAAAPATTTQAAPSSAATPMTPTPGSAPTAAASTVAAPSSAASPTEAALAPKTATPEVETTPGPASNPSALSSQPVSVDSYAPQRGSHLVSLLLGGGALVAGAFAVTGAAEVASYNSYLSSAQQHPGTQAWDSGRPGAATAWDVVAVATGILAAAGIAGAVIIW